MKKIRRAVIVKTGDKEFVKYEYVDNLIRFAAFLDKKFPDWRYMNVFDRETRKQIGNYTKTSRPLTPI